MGLLAAFRPWPERLFLLRACPFSGVKRHYRVAALSFMPQAMPINEAAMLRQVAQAEAITLLEGRCHGRIGRKYDYRRHCHLDAFGLAGIAGHSLGHNRKAETPA